MRVTAKFQIDNYNSFYIKIKTMSKFESDNIK